MTQENPKIRLYVAKELAAGHGLALNIGQSHYLAHVMRCAKGDAIAVFNGRDGEWLAIVTAIEKKAVTLTLQRCLMQQKYSPDLWLVFAPIKNKVDIVVEKATELGVSALLAVHTQHAVVRSLNMDKLGAHAIEAAEQSGRHDVPHIEERPDLAAMLASWPEDRTLLYGDESGGGTPLKTLLSGLPKGKYAVLVGPEGGFSAAEHRLLKSAPLVRPFSMGPRILRADTAAVAALACVQAWLGDWHEQPHFEANG